MPVSKKPRKKGQRARDLAVLKKFVRGKFKDADDARRTIASLERQKTRQRRRCEQLGWLLGFQEKDSLLEAFTLSFFRARALADDDRLLGLQPDQQHAHARRALSQVPRRCRAGSARRHPTRRLHDRRLRSTAQPRQGDSASQP